MRLVIITAAIAAGLSVPAQAQTTAAKFDTQTAARCDVAFARMAEAMKTASNVPEETRTAALIGLTFWEYELTASAPGEEAKLSGAVNAAIETLAAEMPDGEDEADERGEFLMRRATECSRMIDEAYPVGDHPVLTELRQQAAASKADAPSKRPKKGLR